MKRPTSLSTRLLAFAAVSITVSLVVAGVMIGFLLHHFVLRTVDERLDTQIVFLASMLRADDDRRLSLAGNADGPPFDRPGRGWYWQVRGPSNTLRARALAADTLDIAPPRGLPPPGPPLPPRPIRPEGPPPRPADGPGPDGEALHFRLKTVMVGGMPAEIVAAAPRAAIWDPLASALTMLGLCLAALEAVLLLAILLQVRLGLRPLVRLRAAVADVRAGRRERLPADQPAEVTPLAVELNALLEQNAATLVRARGHVANLAHGLKTPLATLGIALSREMDERRELVRLVEVMERRIRHHLGRARAAALAGPTRSRTQIALAIEDLGGVLGKVYAERAISFSADLPRDLAVACEPQDFDEIAGNLLDNAFKWARQSVWLQAAAEERTVLLQIDDDGPGLPAEQVPHLLKPGQRLDEDAPGFGFGLSIARELAELYGGDLALVPSPRGGLRVNLHLPLAHQMI